MQLLKCVVVGNIKYEHAVEIQRLTRWLLGILMHSLFYFMCGVYVGGQREVGIKSHRFRIHPAALSQLKSVKYRE